MESLGSPVRKSKTADTSCGVPAKPIKKIRLFSLGSSHPATVETRKTLQQFNPNTSPLVSSQKLRINSLFNTNRPSPKFRPPPYEVEDIEDPDDPYYSPPPTFVPPESPNEISVEDFPSSTAPDFEAQIMSSSTNQQYKPGALRPTPTTDQHYKGVILRPNQLASLTSYGAFVSSAVAPGGKYSQSDLQAAESLADLSVAQNPSLVNRDCNPSTCNTIARNPSEQTAIDNSPTTSDAEIHPSAGVSLNQVDSTIPSTTHHQTTTFSKLAKQQGIRDWNNSVFDDRWLLQPEEMWNLNPRSNSGVTVSPGRQSLNGNSFGGQHPATRITEASHPATVLKSQMERLIQEAGERKSEIRNRHGPTEPLNARWAGIHNPLAAYGQLVDTDEEHHGNRLVSTPPEAENLRVCVHELVTGNGGLPSGLPYRADILRKYFYERVFGDSRGPHPFYGDEGKNMTEAGGRFISLETLRDQILKDIEDLVQYMISPAGEGMRSEGAARKSTTPTNDNEPAFSDQLAVVESRNSHRSHLKSPTGASSTVEMPIDQRRNVRPQSSNDEGILRKSQMDLLRNAGHNRAQVQGTFLDPSLHKKSEQGLSAFHQGGVAPSITTQGIVGDMNLPPAAIQPFGYGVASQSQFAAYPNQMLVGSSVYPFHMPLQQQWAYQQPPYIASQPAPYGPPLQPAYVQPGYSVYGQQPPMTDRPDYGPLPIPSHRPYARPPAANRVARIYAQTTAWQAPENAQVHGNFGAPTRATEWQNRFSPQPNVVPDLPSLPYRAGSDVMYPKSTGGSSIRFQNITRDTPPNIDVVAAEENIPFMETAKLTKPSEWGVLKIANIPYDLTKTSVLQFLGPHAKVITPDFGPCIHIIMDRGTGKTMDCFVEFYSTPDARATSNSINLRSHGANRIGDRIVEVSVSSQEQLLMELFPKAKNVSWEGGRPKVLETQELFNSGFKSFVSAEEVGNLVRHAEQPHRSNYTQRSAQRTYEAMISLLAKFPWYSVNNYTIATRNQIFNATRSMLHILSINLNKNYNAVRNLSGDVIGSGSDYSTPVRRQGNGVVSSALLTEDLMKDLLMAGLNAAGFSEKQRWELYETSDYVRHRFAMSPLMQWWPFEVLCRKPRIEEDVVQFYADVIASNPVTRPNMGPFGSIAHITADIDYEASTLEQVGELEWKLFHALLPGGLTGELGPQMEAVMGEHR